MLLCNLEIDNAKYNNNNKFMTSEEYKTFTGMMINKWAKQHGVRRHIQAREELVDYVMDRIMIGDWRFRPDCGMTLNSYRNACAKWAILDLIKKLKREYKRNTLSLEEKHYKYNAESQVTTEVMLNEEAVIREKRDTYLIKNALTPSQYKYYKDYQAGLSQEEMARKHNVTLSNISSMLTKVKQIMEQNNFYV